MRLISTQSRYLGLIAFVLISLIFTIDSSAQENNPQYWANQGSKYYYGRGVQEDYGQAFYWYKKAAEQGVTSAQMMLAFMYFNEQGTTKDVDASIYWNKKAANAGNSYAWNHLGHIYQDLKNYSEALFCFKTAAESSNDDIRKNSLFRIGCFYDYGMGVNKDIEEAKRWYKQSADEGYDYAINRLKKLGGYSPTPKPQQGLGKLTWLSPSSETTLKEYKLRIGVNSPSKVEDVSVYINGELFRGVTPIVNDGYTSTIDKTLILSEGNNEIKVGVKNQYGVSSIEKDIVCMSEQKKQNYGNKRIACVIGNANYKGNELTNPANDATDIANKLENLGFYVIKALNQTRQEMESTLSAFGEKAKEYDVALFYYAGHGVRVDGVNYLIPIDANLTDETSAKYNCTNANQVIDYMDKANCKLKIVILDACRNNPFERSWHRGLDQGGLSIMSAPIGSFIAFSTAPGTTASDGSLGQRNSPYTSALLEELDKPNVSLTDFFQEVLDKVASKTNNKQIPWTSSSVLGKFFFNTK